MTSAAIYRMKVLHPGSAYHTIVKPLQLSPSRIEQMSWVLHPIIISIVRCDAMRCDAMRCDAMRCDAMRCDAMRCDAMRCDAITGYKQKHSSSINQPTSMF